MRSAAILLVALAGLLASRPATACSWGNPERRLQDEIQAYYDAEVVFLARVGKVQTLAPEPEFQQVMWSAPYQVLEVYRGEPAVNGRLASVDWSKPGLHGPMPPPPCSGAVVPPSYEGKRMLVFGSRYAKERDGTTLYGMALSSLPIENCVDCEDVLRRLRLYAKFHQVDSPSR